MSAAEYAAWKQWNAESFGSWSPADEVYFASELKQVGIEAVDGTYILEIGFGNGAFAGWASGRGAYYTGTETIPALVEWGRARGYRVHPAGATLTDLVEANSQDCVVAFDVFEHCDQGLLRKLLEEVYTVLKPGALLLARVPSGDSPFGRAVQHGDWTHRLTFGSSAVHQLADETGFLLTQVRKPAFPLVGMGAVPFLRRLLVSTVRRLAYPVLRWGFMGAGDAVLSPDMVFVLLKPDPGH